jgi:hypothetical protein
MKRIVERIGTSGLAAVALLAIAAAFSSLVITPLEARHERLKETLSRQPRGGAAAPSGDKVAAVYEHLNRGEDTTDWLAKLHAIGVATGVQLKSAAYRTEKTEARIVRYQIVLPVSRSYPQLRDFLKRALAEIPVLSLDQITVRREKDGSNEKPLNAEMKLTLHMVPS